MVHESHETPGVPRFEPERLILLQMQDEGEGKRQEPVPNRPNFSHSPEIWICEPSTVQDGTRAILID